MSPKKETSCADDWEPGALSVSEASKKIIENIEPITGTEKLALRSTLKRFLAEDIYSPIDVPSHLNSAMDGYAIIGTDMPTGSAKSYQIVDTSYAGVPATKTCQKGHVIRIMTGGLIPEGTDTVIMQEQVERLDENTISIKAIEYRVGQNIRQAGEDIGKGVQVLSKGRQINSADLGILASIGIGELRVYRRPRIAFFSTGDELRSIGDTLAAGEIYDSNRYTLYGMLKQLDVEILDMGVVRDTPEGMKAAFEEAAKMADFVVTSGGVSVGEADYIKPTLKKLGSIHFWKIRMKPGRPLTFGKLGESRFFGLPGNPVAVMVTFLQFVQPAIHYLSCGKTKPIINLKATSKSKFHKRAGRFEFQRGIFEQTDEGQLTVTRTGKQGSGILSSMSLANCFILLPEKSEGVEIGGSVEIQPFSGSI